MGDLDPAALATALALASPTFSEVSGLVLLADRADPDNVARWMDSHGREPFAIERVLNEVHLYDLVGDCGEEDLPLLEDAGTRLAACWAAALATRYPGRRFSVEYSSEPDAYGPTVSFHQADGCPGCGASPPAPEAP